MKTSTINKLSLVLVFLLIAVGQSFAAKTKLSKYVYSDDIAVNDIVLVENLTNSVTTIEGVSHRAIVRLVYGRENGSDISATDFDYEVEYTINFPGSGVTGATAQTLTLDFTGTSGDVVEAIAAFEDIGSVVEVEITGITSTFTAGSAAAIQSDIRLEVELITERHSLPYTFSHSLNQLTQDHLIDASVVSNTSGKMIEVAWKYIPGAESYDLEYVFIDAEDDNYTTYTDNYTGSDPFAYKEAVLVNTPDQHHRFSLTYPEGRLFFRVRARAKPHCPGTWTGVSACNYDMKYNYWASEWLYQMNDGSQKRAHYSVTNTNELDEDKSWQVVTAFAEDGKKKEVVTYYDGSLRNRQVLTNLNTDDLVMVGETKYDYEGRPVVQILPVPITGTELSFRTNFNRANGTTDAFFKDDFDRDDLGTTAATLANTSGAEKYYSSQNELLSNAAFNHLPHLDYIAQAEGHPYTQIRYTRDNTGRVARQSGVGDMHRLYGGHDSRFIYGNTNDTELRRLFGSNVGDASHYKKTYSIDPNGQVSVSYIDQEGRVIASALANDHPDNVLELDEGVPANPESITADLMANNLIDEEAGVSYVSYGLVNPDGVSFNATLNYDLTSQLQSENIAYPSSANFLCLNCTYELTVMVTDPDGELTSLTLNTANEISGILNASGDVATVTFEPAGPDICTDDGSTSPTYYTDPGKVILDITLSKQGTYKVHKFLKVIQPDIPTVEETLIDDDLVDPDLQALIDDAYSNIDAVACGNSCEGECFAAAYVRCLDNGGTAESCRVATGTNGYADATYNTCIGNCGDDYTDATLAQQVTVVDCDSRKAEMENQIMPGGYWYENADAGTIDDDFWDNVFADRTNIALNDAAGDPVTIPSVLADMIDFFQDEDNWRDAWVDDLFDYHPEVCLHSLLCNTAGTTGQLFADINEFHVLMSLTENWDDALDNGLFDPTITTANATYNVDHHDGTPSSTDYDLAIGGQDPVFTNANYTSTNLHGVDFEQELLDKLDEYYEVEHPTDANQNVWLSLWEYVHFDTEVDLGGATNNKFFGADQYGPLFDKMDDDATVEAEQHWRKFVALYHEIKLDILNDIIDAADASCTSSPGGPDGYLEYQDGSDWIAHPEAVFPDPLKQKADAVANSGTYPNQDFENYIENTLADDAVTDHCTEMKAAMVEEWMRRLKNYVEQYNCGCEITAAQSDQLYYGITEGSPIINQSAVKFVLEDYWDNEITCDADNLFPDLTRDDFYDVTFQSYYDLIKTRLGTYCPTNECTISPCATNCNDMITVNESLERDFVDSWLNIIQNQLCGSVDWTVTANYDILDDPNNTSTDVRAYLESYYADEFIAPGEPVTITLEDLLSGNTDLDALLDLLNDNFSCNPFVSAVHSYGPQFTYDPQMSPCINVAFDYLNEEVFDGTTLDDSHANVEDASGSTGDSEYDLRSQKFDDGTYTHNLSEMTFDPYDRMYFTSLNGNTSTDPQTIVQFGYGETPTTCDAFMFYTQCGDVIELDDIASAGIVQSWYVPSLHYTEGEEMGTTDYLYSGIMVNIKLKSGAVTQYTDENGSPDPCPDALVDPDANDDIIRAYMFVPETGGCDFDCTPDDPTVYSNTETIADCIDFLYEEAEFTANLRWREVLDGAITNYMNEYRETCSFPTETFTVAYDLKEYQYTLYYYDQAGDLVQTVPPEGVDVLDGAHFTNGVWKATSSDEPVHRLKTKYAYNATGQIIQSKVPDHDGDSKFYYDDKQRLTISQNAEQAVNDEYSFTTYDALGRIVSAGEFEDVTATPFDADNPLHVTSGGYPTIAGLAGNIREAALIVYTDVELTGQTNLRNRASASYRFENVGANGMTQPYADHAMYYSYDAQGNIDVLKIDNDITGTKTITYDFDLISRNVNKVCYQPGETDQLIHGYSYNADDRIIKVRTSKDGDLWEEDARYFYYPQGPLARIELNEDNIQGLDYYYTIHGWLKGVNTPGQDHDADVDGTGLDIGQDGFYANGTDNLHHHIGRDEIAYSLGYYEGDYSSIQTTNLGAASLAWSDFSSITNGILKDGSEPYGLFNGNIVHMASDVAAFDDGTTDASLQSMAYQYDQLHRIKQSRSYNWTGTGWDRNTDVVTGYSPGQYDTEYTYDQNGNLETLNRWNDAGTQFDGFSYEYDDNLGNDPKEDNRLLYVTDNSLYTSREPDDIDNQSSGNYDYDEIGNLISDDAENIDEVIWSVTGKILEIKKTASGSNSDLVFQYDAQGNRVLKLEKTRSSGAFDAETSWKATYYIRDMSGNIMSVYEGNWTASSPTLTDGDATDQPIYGSSRIGTVKRESGDNNDTRELGNKAYELSNHLGNVLITITDVRVATDDQTFTTGTGLYSSTSDDIVDYYRADVGMAKDYYPFGMELVGTKRSHTGTGTYRFGFQGQEGDDEVAGSGNSIFFKYRVHDPRLGRFLSLDPLAPDYPHNSPYAFSENKVIAFVELEGLEAASHEKTRTGGDDGGSKQDYDYSWSEGTSENKQGFGSDIYSVTVEDCWMCNGAGYSARYVTNVTNDFEVFIATTGNAVAGPGGLGGHEVTFMLPHNSMYLEAGRNITVVVGTYDMATDLIIEGLYVQQGSGQGSENYVSFVALLKDATIMKGKSVNVGKTPVGLTYYSETGENHKEELYYYKVFSIAPSFSFLPVSVGTSNLISMSEPTVSPKMTKNDTINEIFRNLEDAKWQKFSRETQGTTNEETLREKLTYTK